MSCRSDVQCICLVVATTMTTVVTPSVTVNTTTTGSPGVTLFKPCLTLAGSLKVNCAVLGKTSCSGICVNTSIDMNKCGSCNTVCSPPTACCNGC